MIFQQRLFLSACPFLRSFIAAWPTIGHYSFQLIRDQDHHDTSGADIEVNWRFVSFPIVVVRATRTSSRHYFAAIFDSGVSTWITCPVVIRWLIVVGASINFYKIIVSCCCARARARGRCCQHWSSLIEQIKGVLEFFVSH